MGIGGGCWKLLKAWPGAWKVVDFNELPSDEPVAIDAPVWLHSICAGHAEEVLQGTHDAVVSGFMRRLKCLRTANLIPVVVFDSVGATSSDKGPEQERRTAKREKAYQSWMDMGWEALTDDQKADKESEKKRYLQAALSIKPKLVWQVIRELRLEGYSYFVAPGEADHQLVHAVQSGMCQCALTIDGDMLAHGIPVTRNFNFNSGTGICVSTLRVSSARRRNASLSTPPLLVCPTGKWNRWK
jgi:5'-3' exonuclease